MLSLRARSLIGGTLDALLDSRMYISNQRPLSKVSVKNRERTQFPSCSMPVALSGGRIHHAALIVLLGVLLLVDFSTSAAAIGQRYGVVVANFKLTLPTLSPAIKMKTASDLCSCLVVCGSKQSAGSKKGFVSSDQVQQAQFIGTSRMSQKVDLLREPSGAPVKPVSPQLQEFIAQQAKSKINQHVGDTNPAQPRPFSGPRGPKRLN
ncbi:UNVERIFIED_ORG: hypothetical protein J2W74_002037 [Methylorubrum zatmanii]